MTRTREATTKPLRRDQSKFRIKTAFDVAVMERSPLAKAAAGLPAVVAQPPGGSNPFPLRHLTPPPDFSSSFRLSSTHWMTCGFRLFRRRREAHGE
jgi:hypothetical protein